MKPRYTKQKASMSTAHGGAGFVAAARYCSMQALLSGFEPWFYNAGIYGWNNDTYFIRDSDGNTWAISTGYRNMQAEHLPYTLYYIRQLSLSQRYIIVCETAHNYTPLLVSGYRYPGAAEKHLREIQNALFACGELDYIPGASTKMYCCTADLKFLQQHSKFTECNPREFVKKWYV